MISGSLTVSQCALFSRRLQGRSRSSPDRIALVGCATHTTTTDCLTSFARFEIFHLRDADTRYIRNIPWWSIHISFSHMRENKLIQSKTSNEPNRIAVFFSPVYSFSSVVVRNPRRNNTVYLYMLKLSFNALFGLFAINRFGLSRNYFWFQF